MIRVKEIMTTDVITVSPDTEICEAARLLLENRINGLPVVDGEGRMVGILCQSDLVAQQKKIPFPTVFTLMEGMVQITSRKQMDREINKIAALTVADAMTPGPVTVGPENSLETVAALMVDKNLHTLPVMDRDRLVGIVGKEDVLRTLC